MTNFTDSLSKLKVKKVPVQSINQIMRAAIEAAEPLRVVERNIELTGNCLRAGDKTLQLYPDSRIVVIAIGKAGLDMARGAVQKMGRNTAGGVVICKHNPEGIGAIGKVKVMTGSHPVPDQRSVDAAVHIRQIMNTTKIHDLVLLLVSGGGSALVCLPAPGISLQDMQTITSALLKSGASINELNAVRKHLDLIKGGGLLRMAAPAQLAALVISDVVNNPLDVIASGPAVPDPSTFNDARKILESYIGLKNIPDSILNRIEAGYRGEIEDTLKHGDPLVTKGTHTIIASNQISAQAALRRALQEGYDAEIITCELTGEARTAGEYLAGLIKSRKATMRPYLGIAGGETTVKVTGKGLGGRNLEVALGAVAELDGVENGLLITLATDGEDGPTNSAGAYVTGETLLQAVKMQLNPAQFLENNDAYHFFEKAGGLILTGPSGTNVNDLNFIFRFPQV